jgi:hypothetical protein
MVSVLCAAPFRVPTALFRQFHGEVRFALAQMPQDRRRGDAHIVGYYVLVYADTRPGHATS